MNVLKLLREDNKYHIIAVFDILAQIYIMKHIKGLDTLRAFAVIFVIVAHWGLPFDNSTTMYRILMIMIPEGKFGVNLFFVLSGFLITSILMNAVDNGEEGRFTILKNFIIRRALRIFPIYYLTIFVLVLLNYPYLGDHIWWFVGYISNILVYKEQFWNPFSHTWSLSVEEQFYLIWPWLIIFTSKRHIKYVLYVSILIGIGMSFYTAKIHPNRFGLVLMPSCLQAFGIGGLYSYISKDIKAKKLFLRVLNIAFPVALLLHFYWAYSAPIGSFNYLFRTIDSIISIWLIHRTIVAKDGWAKTWLLENPVLMKIGQISYGIYLLHGPLVYVYDVAVRNTLGGTPIGKFLLFNAYASYGMRLVILYVLCIISFKYFEKPIMKLKKYFEYKGPPVIKKHHEVYEVAN